MLTFADIAPNKEYPTNVGRFTRFIVWKETDEYFIHLYSGYFSSHLKYFKTLEEIDAEIRKYTNSLNLQMFSDFLREVIFAMRRLEALDQPPCPITICTLINRWMTARDDGWEAYNSFMKWYWEIGQTPHMWVKKGSPRLVGV